MPRYLLSTHSAAGTTREPMTEEQMQKAWEPIQALEAEMKSAGAWVFSARLHDPDTATVVRVSGDEVVTTDGPFVEAKEHLAGLLHHRGGRSRCSPRLGDQGDEADLVADRGVALRGHGRRLTLPIVDDALIGPGLPRRVRSVGRHPDPHLRRHRSGRGCGPGGIHPRSAKVAGRRSAAEPRWLDHDDRSQSGHRSPPSRGARARAPRACGRRRRRTVGRRGRARGRRSTPPDLHLLPPGPLDRGADRVDAAAARWPQHGRGGARLPGRRTDDGQATGPGKAQDQGGPHPVPGPVRG